MKANKGDELRKLNFVEEKSLDDFKLNCGNEFI